MVVNAAAVVRQFQPMVLSVRASVVGRCILERDRKKVLCISNLYVGGSLLKNEIIINIS